MYDYHNEIIIVAHYLLFMTRPRVRITIIIVLHNISCVLRNIFKGKARKCSIIARIIVYDFHLPRSAPHPPPNSCGPVDRRPCVFHPDPDILSVKKFAV